MHRGVSKVLLLQFNATANRWNSCLSEIHDSVMCGMTMRLDTRSQNTSKSVNTASTAETH